MQSPAGGLTAGSWYYVATTYDGATGKIFINDVQVASTALGSFTPQTTYDLYVGYQPAGPTTYFAGAVGDIAVYNRALSAAEIAVNCNALIKRYPGAVCH